MVWVLGSFALFGSLAALKCTRPKVMVDDALLTQLELLVCCQMMPLMSVMSSAVPAD